jgi:hypothetical protein
LAVSAQSILLNAVKRARILKDGQLTMIVYGADEALKWQLRISKFFGLIRSVLFLLIDHARRGSVMLTDRRKLKAAACRTLRAM